MSSFVTRYPTIAGIPIVFRMGGVEEENPQFSPDGRPQIHMNAAAIDMLGHLIVWKEYDWKKENNGQQ